MKQYVVLGLTLVGVIALVMMFKPKVTSKPIGTKQTYSYVVFELDSNVRTIATAYGTAISYDTSRTVGDKVEKYRDTAYYVWWPLTLLDSLKHPIKTKSGQDSTVKQWVYLQKGAVLLDLGRGKP